MKENILFIIDKYDSLKLAFKFIINNNTANFAPYHNFNHLLTVTKHTYYALDYMKMLDDERVESLLFAALFHDFNHSMGKLVDAINISIAKDALIQFIKDNKLEHLDIKFICEVIDVTQFPYVVEEKDLNIYQKILRDADLCQSFEYDYIKQITLGLGSEWNKSIDEMLEIQKKFNDNLNLMTTYGKMMQKKHLPVMIKELTILENIMKS